MTDPGADTFTYAWAVTKNGSPFTTGTTKDFTFVPDDEGLFTVSLVVTDDDGGSSGTLSYELTALNVKPAPTILGTTGAVEGQTVTLSAEVNDPGPLDVAVYSWEVRLQGQLFASGSAPTLSFLPADNGVYFVSVVVSDDDPNDPSDDAVAGIGAQAVLVIVSQRRSGDHFAEHQHCSALRGTGPIGRQLHRQRCGGSPLGPGQLGRRLGSGGPRHHRVERFRQRFHVAHLFQPWVVHGRGLHLRRRSGPGL